MKDLFLCSLICDNGVIGGILKIENNAITYTTNKFTVDKCYKNIFIPLNKITKIKWSRLILPIATICLLGGEQYKFLMFNKKRFENVYNTKTNN